MKDKEILVFKTLLQLLTERPKNTRYHKHLKILVEHTLSFYENNGQDFEKIQMSKKDIIKAEFKNNPNHPQVDNTNAINPKKIKDEVAYFVYSDNGIVQEFLDLGYIPYFDEYKTDGGYGILNYYSLKIEKINNQNKFVEKTNSTSKIHYNHREKSLVKLSIIAKIFFDENHELKMMSFKGVLLLFILINSFFVDLIIISLLLVSMFIIYDFLKIGSIIIPTSIFLLLLAFFCTLYHFYIPLNKIVINRIVKAPFPFKSFNQDNAEIEFFGKEKGYKYNIARITEIRSTCPICTAPILLMNGKPDQSAPLVGRCIEAPHAHIYSFDRVSMVGYFLGHPAYLKEQQND